MIYFDDIVLNQPLVSRPFLVEKADSIAFAREWDPQPFHIDEQAASQWPLGLTASGLHTIAIAVKLGNELSTEPVAVIAGLGWDEVRLKAPVKPGDSLVLHSWMEEKRASQSKPDRGIVVTRIELRNQNDEIVLTYKVTSMMLKKPA